jgi:hypothetical protein
VCISFAVYTNVILTSIIILDIIILEKYLKGVFFCRENLIFSLTQLAFLLSSFFSMLKEQEVKTLLNIHKKHTL